MPFLIACVLATASVSLRDRVPHPYLFIYSWSPRCASDLARVYQVRSRWRTCLGALLHFTSQRPSEMVSRQAGPRIWIRCVRIRCWLDCNCQSTDFAHGYGWVAVHTHSAWIRVLCVHADLGDYRQNTITRDTTAILRRRRHDSSRRIEHVAD